MSSRRLKSKTTCRGKIFRRINFETPHLPGVLPDVGETRNYPYGADAAFVLGYVGAVTDRDLAAPENEEDRTLLRQPGFKVGRDGLERTYEKELRGQAGEMDVKINAHGRVIQELKDSAVPPVQGATLALTIDAELQQKASEVLAAHEEGEDPISGAAVVLDIKSGDILVHGVNAFLSIPMRFNVGIDPQYWKELNESPYKPLLNKSFSGVYPPGSTFKMITAIAAQMDGRRPSQTVRTAPAGCITAIGFSIAGSAAVTASST